MSIICAVSAESIRAKWIELCCETSAPQNRQQLIAWEHYDTLARLWKPHRLGLFQAMRRGEYAADDLWDEIVAEYSAALAESHRSTVGESPYINPLQAWTWTASELRRFYVAPIADSDAPADIGEKHEYRRSPGQGAMTASQRVIGPKYTFVADQQAPSLARMRDPSETIRPNFRRFASANQIIAHQSVPANLRTPKWNGEPGSRGSTAEAAHGR